MCSVMKEKMASDLSAPYEVVIASFSLGMQDIRSAVEKMVLASSRYVTSIILPAPLPGTFSGRSCGLDCTTDLTSLAPRLMCSTMFSIRWASILISGPSGWSTTGERGAEGNVEEVSKRLPAGGWRVICNAGILHQG